MLPTSSILINIAKVEYELSSIIDPKNMASALRVLVLQGGLQGLAVCTIQKKSLLEYWLRMVNFVG